MKSDIFPGQGAQVLHSMSPLRSRRWSLGPWVPGSLLQIVTLSAGAARDLALPPVSKMRTVHHWSPQV